MAQSFVSSAGNGTTKTFTVPFDYLDKTHVKVYLNDVLSTAYTWASAGQITFTTAPASGVSILIRRETPSTPLIDFTSRARWQTSDLNLASKQALYRAVEAIETSTKFTGGVGAPTAVATDNEGDLYLNVSNGNVFSRGATSWTNIGNIKGATGNTGATGAQGATGATGATGAAGAAGSVWYTGASDPLSALGVNGDYYLKQSDGGVYAKVSGSWYLVTNIKGPTGATGAQGPQGIQGPQGAQGIQGIRGPKGDTSPGLPTGGTSGQILVKQSATNYDYTWATPTGGGDMIRVTYDANNDGIVDQASSVPWSGITNVPSTLAYLTGALFTGRVTTPNPGTTAGFGIGSVSADPTTLVNGDLWITSGLLKVRLASTSRTVALVDINNVFATKQTFQTPSTSGASIRMPHGVAPTNPADGDVWTTTSGIYAQINGSTALVSLDGHVHAIADVTGLQTALDGKAALAHTHAIADVTNLQTTLDGKAALAHTHAIADVTNLQTTLNGKAASVHTHAIADTTGLQTALDGKAALSHTHAIADVTGLSAALTAATGGAKSTVLTSGTAATFTVDSRTKLMRVRVVGGGGGGGGCNATASNQGGAGSGGSYLEKFINPQVSGYSYQYTIGAAGSAGAAGANAGGNGGTTTFDLLAATGAALAAAGGGGGAAGNSITTKYTPPGAAPTAGDVNQTGTYGVTNGAITNGGNSTLGSGGYQTSVGSSGLVGSGYGAGGSSAMSNGVSHSGGAGTAGAIIVEEYW